METWSAAGGGDATAVRTSTSPGPRTPPAGAGSSLLATRDLGNKVPGGASYTNSSAGTAVLDELFTQQQQQRNKVGSSSTATPPAIATDIGSSMGSSGGGTAGGVTSASPVAPGADSGLALMKLLQR
eukprot:gene1730-2073_t